MHKRKTKNERKGVSIKRLYGMASSTYYMPIPDDTRAEIIRAIDNALRDLGALPFERRIEQHENDRAKEHERLKQPRGPMKKALLSGFRYPKL